MKYKNFIKKYPVGFFIIFFVMALLMPQSVNGQSISQLIEQGDEQAAIRDYQEALIWYEKAMQRDSLSIDILWKYAETLRLYKDYVRAEEYYKKVYKKGGRRIHKKSIFWLATMQKYNGNYEDALYNWKRARKIYKKELDSYEFEKCKQEIKSCLWAKKAIRDTSNHRLMQLPEPVNSPDTEFAPFVFNGKIYFTSMKADSVSQEEVVNPQNGEKKKESEIDYWIQIFQADKQDSLFENVQPFKSVQEKGFNSANGSFSPDGKRFYFSRCRDYSCKIFVGEVEGDEIVDIDSLGEIINEYGYLATMPHSAQVGDQEVLFFVSNIPHNYGGLDLWYSFVEDGNQYSLPKSVGQRINTPDDEITPYYDESDGRLYFSSSWHEGFGGQDIFSVEVSLKDDELEFGEVVNMGIPFNSSANDTYLTKDQKDDRFYFSSNRLGTTSVKNPTCCNDIYSAHIEIAPEPDSTERMAEINQYLPVLYFHNDRPNPRTRDTVTNLNYLVTYSRYMKRMDEYKDGYAEGLNGESAEDAKLDMEDLFLEYVEQGVEDLKLFTPLLLAELDRGYDIELTVQGFCSNLANTAYNVPLAKRRISSLKNYFVEYEQGIFQKYIDQYAENGGRLTFNEVPLGEYTANPEGSDNPQDLKHSVYSKVSALERKIVVQKVAYREADTSVAKMKFVSERKDFGDISAGKKLTHSFQFTNTGQQNLDIGELISDCACVIVKIDKETYAPGESGSIHIEFDPSTQSGKTFVTIRIPCNIAGGYKEISVSADVE